MNQAMSTTNRGVSLPARLLKKPEIVVGCLIVLVWVLLALFAPLIAPFDPLEQSVKDRLQPPNSVYRLGTDELGRDILSRVLYGGRLLYPQVSW